MIYHEKFMSELIKKYFEHTTDFLMTIFVKMIIQLHLKNIFQKIFIMIFG
jgi:hypothetical protein